MGKPDIRKLSFSPTDDMFRATTSSPSQQEGERIVELPLTELFTFKNHPFHVKDDEDMLKTAESIKKYGVLVPGIVRPRIDGGYEIVAGHRRKRGSEMAGKTTMPVIVREMDDNVATIIMVDTNLQREHILPSERAFAYRMKLDAMKRQGARSDLSSPQLAAMSDGDTAPQLAAKSFRTDDIIAAEDNTSGDTVRRFIRLTYLIPRLLEMVDAGKLKFGPAVELSFLSEKEQELVFDLMQRDQTVPSLEQAKKLREASQKGELNQSVFTLVFMDDKPIKGTISLKAASVKKFYPESTPKEIEASLITLAGTYSRLKEFFALNTPQDEIMDTLIRLVQQHKTHRN